MIATAPGKLILTGEYAVLDGAPALVVAVDRRAVAHRRSEHPHGRPSGSSPFLVAVAAELAAQLGADHPAARAALEISVDSSAFYQGTMKLGLGSSAAVTVAAVANALGSVDDRERILAIALAAHARAQEPVRGSGADVAAAVHGGVLVYTMRPDALPHIERKPWPASVRLLAFHTGHAADTTELVARVTAARAASPTTVEPALAAVADASRAACTAIAYGEGLLPAPFVPGTSPLPDLGPSAAAVVAAFSLGARAIDQLAAATGIDLVPECVTAARHAMVRFSGTAKTTGAAGGDIGIAVVPASADVTEVTRSLIEAKCQPLVLSIDSTGVDTRSQLQ